MVWLDHLRENDPAFQRALREAWGDFDSAVTELTRAGGVLDQYAEELRPSWERDRQKWRGDGASLDAQVAALKTFLLDRRATVRANMDELLTKVHCTITFADGDRVLSTGVARSGDPLYTSLKLEKPEKDGYLFLGWEDPDGETVDEGSVFVRDTVVRARFQSEEDATRPDYIFFRPWDMWLDIRNGYDEIPVMFIPEDAQDKRIQWESSDAGAATAGLDEYGAFTVTAGKVGEAVITGAMKSGLQRSITVHVYDPAETPSGELTALAPRQDTLSLKAGERGQMLMALSPGNSHPQLTFASSDETVATVDEWFGVVTALRPGRCTITVTDAVTGLHTQHAVVVAE